MANSNMFTVKGHKLTFCFWSHIFQLLASENENEENAKSLIIKGASFMSLYFSVVRCFHFDFWFPQSSASFTENEK